MRRPDRRAEKKARRFLEEVRALEKRHAERLSPDERQRLATAMGHVEQSLSGAPEALRLSAALTQLDSEVEHILGFARRGSVYEYLESILIAALIALTLRGFVFEAFKIPTGSMIPTLAVGDRIFVNKVAYGLRLPLTDRWLTQWSAPRHGDVIVFRFPRDLSKDYIKRVVAVEGDRVRVDGQHVFINGERLARRLGDSYRYVDEGEDEDTLDFGVVRQVLAYAETSGGGDGREYTVIYKPSDPARLRVPANARLPGLDCTAEEPQARGTCTVLPGHVFVMGDNRDNSSDSRVWGAVPVRLVKGRASFVFWSRGPKTGIAWGRLGTVVR